MIHLGTSQPKPLIAPRRKVFWGLEVSLVTLWVWGIALLSLSAVALTRVWNLEDAQHPWMVILVATLAWAYGLGAGLGAAGLAFALEIALSGTGHAGWFGVILLATALLGAQMSHGLRRAYQRQKQASQRLYILSEALNKLARLGSRELLLEAIPTLLSSPHLGKASVWVADPSGAGFQTIDEEDYSPLYPDGPVGQAHRQGRVVYAKYPAGEGFAVALPLFERGEVVAVLLLERSQPFSEWEGEGLEGFTHTVSTRLTRLSERAEIRLVADLSSTVAFSDSILQVADQVLAITAVALDMDGGILLMQQGNRMCALGHWGEADASTQSLFGEGAAYGQGPAWKVYQTQQPLFVDGVRPAQTMVMYPILLPGLSRARIVLGLADGKPRRWRQAERELLASAARAIGIALERAITNRRREVILRLYREALEAPPETLFQQVVERAVEFVPGAEAGSLLVREGDRFHFRAAVGFDWEALSRISFSEADQRRWYGAEDSAWEHGEPRILINQGTSLSELDTASSEHELLRTAGRLEEIQSNLCVPITYRGEVLALLYLDNFQDPNAFDRDSVEVARFFSTPVAALLHEVRYRRLLQNAAQTDALTALPNRRAFDRRMEEELERARRNHHPLALLVMDLRGFKAINDRLGHAKGDQALIQVAQTLQAQQRMGDGLYRWGGDEFAAILPHVGQEGAEAAARRYAEAVARIRIEGLALGVNIGIATFPLDGWIKDELLSHADEQMYRAKRLDAEGMVLPEPAVGVPVYSLPKGAE